MKKTLAGSIVLAGVLLFAGQASAQDNSQEDALSYRDAMKCSAIHAYLAGVSEAFIDDVPKAAEAAAANTGISEHWMVLAIRRDGYEGDRATEELPIVVDALGEKITEFEGNNPAATQFLQDVVSRCQSLQQANAAEYAAAGVSLTE